jgi:cell division protein FtsZ
MPINISVPNLAELKPRITVFGVGGAGGNAVNNMIESHLEGVEFVVANTDAQALSQSAAERCVHMGTALTQGLGAGSQPQIGAAAAEEALPEILDHMAGAHMVFITAGMGGGTGSGAAPIIARAAKEQGVLTVGVVTKPFHFEGQRRMQTAERGIEQLAKHVDTLIIIPNQNLFRVANEKTTFAAAFAMADQVLYSGVASITELMTKEGLINLDFADVRAIMSDMGKAMMGTGEASGEKRAVEAAEAAISNPLLDDVSMRGARGLLISITGGPDLTLYEIDEAATRIREEVDAEANIILGATFDETLEGTMRVSVVATGLAEEAAQAAVAKPGEEYDTVSGRLVYGFSGTRAPEPAPEEQPAAAAPQHQSAPQAPREPAAQPAAASAQDNHGQADQQVLDTQPRAQKMAPRMPRPDEFPPIAQRQMQAHQSQAAGGEPKKRRGLIERLASVGLGRREAAPAASRSQPEPVPAPVAEQRSEPRMQAIPEDNRGPQQAVPQQTVPQQIGNVHTITPPNAQTHQQGNDPAIDPGLDDDQLEIPAFLRRQAN